MTTTTRRPRPAWCLTWRSPVMPAPAFWYFASEAGALEAQREMSLNVVTSVRYVAECYSDAVDP